MATYSYQVQRSADGGSTWSDITGASGTFTATPPFTNHNIPYTIQAADASDDLRIKITDPNGIITYSSLVGPVAGGGGGTPAAYPSILKTSGPNLVDTNGFTMARMRGFNVQVVPWSAQSFLDMYNKGARILRTVIFWNDIETTKGQALSSYITSLDTHIERVVAAGLYTTLCFYWAPAQHWPGWYTTANGWPTNGGTNMGVLTAANTSGTLAGQFIVEYLAKRYGDPSNPLGAPDATYNTGANAGKGKYTPAVIGFGVNEPAPDNDSIANYLNLTHLPQQKTMMQWFRTYAANWIGIISMAWGGGCPLPNVSGSGQGTSQTFTGAAVDPFAGMGNWMIDLHAYFETTVDGASRTWDGRNASGAPNGSNQIQPNQTAYPSYPPSGITRAQCQASLAAYFASDVAYCGPAHANVPLMIGEWGWVPLNSGVTFTGGDNYATDVAAAFGNAGAAIEIAWDYNTTQSSDPWAVRPGSGASGAAADGWQTATETWLAAA